jgi:hypothetical protein
MWKRVLPGEWPSWAVGVDSLWLHKGKHWLSGRTNSRSTLWELRTPEGVVYRNQLDLPFTEAMDAPLEWATRELLEEVTHAQG